MASSRGPVKNTGHRHMDDRTYLDEVSDILKTDVSRRRFVRNLVLGPAGAAFLPLVSVGPSNAAIPDAGGSTVSFVTGDDRREMMRRVLEPLKRDIKKAVRGRQVIIKPNLVGNDNILCATHPDAIRGVLDFLKPIYKEPVLIAESTGRRYRGRSGTFTHYRLYNYPALEREYDVRLVDLNERGTITEWLMTDSGHPLDIRTIDAFQDRGNYFISLCRLKTHAPLIVTMTAKNVIMASPINDDVRHEKRRMHSVGAKTLNFNMFLLALKIRPDLAVIDGLEGMEGDGPTQGTRVRHGVALASTDFVAADMTGCRLMGVDPADVGYLTYCANAGLGQGNPDRIRILGPDPARHVIDYKLHRDIERMLRWKF